MCAGRKTGVRDALWQSLNWSWPLSRGTRRSGQRLLPKSALSSRAEIPPARNTASRARMKKGTKDPSKPRPERQISE